jgi:SPP1 gp7 family putative phage head morphogenesis protein
LFYALFFVPMMKHLDDVKDNAAPSKSALIRAIDNDTLVYRDGAFEGERNSTISRLLKNMGAIFNRTRKAWMIPTEKLPVDIRNAIGKANQRSAARERSVASALHEIHQTVKEIMPKFSFQGYSRETLLKMADKVRATIPAEVALLPKIDLHAQKKLNQDYTDNVRLSIVGFLDDEVLRFRDKILPQIRKGLSRKEMQQYVDARLGVARERAKFIAREETSLFTSKLKEVQYKSAGIEKYRWKAIGGSRGDGRTRESHMRANGLIFYFGRDRNDDGISKPVNARGQATDPGIDFGCRCQAVPIVESI